MLCGGMQAVARLANDSFTAQGEPSRNRRLTKDIYGVASL